MPSSQWYIDAAIQEYGSDVIEFEDTTVAPSEGKEGGAWVSAWVWVEDPDDADYQDDETREQTLLARRAARYDHDQNYLEGE